MQEMKKWKLQNMEHFSLHFQSRQKRAFEYPTPPRDGAGKEEPDFINFICSYVSPE